MSSLLSEHDQEIIDKINAKKDIMVALLDEAREEFVKAWLLAMGWDGKSPEQAREIAKDYDVKTKVKNGVATFEMIKAVNWEEK